MKARIVAIIMLLGIAASPLESHAAFPDILTVEEAKESVKKAEQSGTQEEQATAYIDLAVAYIIAGDFSAVEPYYKKAVAILKEIGKIPEVARVTETLADLYYTYGVKEKACSLWKDAEEIWQSAEEAQGDKIYDVQERIAIIQKLMKKAGCV